MFLTKSFESNEIRFVEVDGVVYAVGVDVARALGYADPNTTILRKVYSEYKTIVKTSRVTGEVDTVAISEPGIYQLIFGSKLESADRFRRWVFEEVLPSLRQTGTYTVPNPQRIPPEPLKVTETLINLDNSSLPASVKQLLIDSCVNAYLTNQTALPASEERWLGAVQRAEELGFKLNPGLRSQLGKFIKRQGFESRKIEERLCNGQMRPINVYLVSDALDTAISDFFAIRALTATP